MTADRDETNGELGARRGGGRGPGQPPVLSNVDRFLHWVPLLFLCILIVLVVLLLRPQQRSDLEALWGIFVRLILFSVLLMLVPLLLMRFGSPLFGGLTEASIVFAVACFFLIVFLLSSLLLYSPTAAPLGSFFQKIGADDGQSFLVVLGAVFTFWAAGATVLILLAQTLSASRAREAIGVAIVSAIDHSIRPMLATTEAEIIREMKSARVQEVKDEHAVKAFQEWVERADVERITYFGAFSAVPGFWMDYARSMGPFFAKPNPNLGKVQLLGPDGASIEELGTLLLEPESGPMMEEMMSWSELVENLDPKLVRDQYRGRLQLIESNGVKTTLLKKPWEQSTITFALAVNGEGNAVGALFFGSPNQSDTFKPGEIKNVSHKPRIYSATGPETCSLLIHLLDFLSPQRPAPAASGASS